MPILFRQLLLGLNGDKSYSPNPITIEEGKTITWYNGDTISHTVTSGQDNDNDAGEDFDSNAIRYLINILAFTFDDSGEYPVLLYLSSFNGRRSNSRVTAIY